MGRERVGAYRAGPLGPRALAQPDPCVGRGRGWRGAAVVAGRCAGSCGAGRGRSREPARGRARLRVLRARRARGGDAVGGDDARGRERDAAPRPAAEQGRVRVVARERVRRRGAHLERGLRLAPGRRPDLKPGGEPRRRPVAELPERPAPGFGTTGPRAVPRGPPRACATGAAGSRTRPHVGPAPAHADPTATRNSNEPTNRHRRSRGAAGRRAHRRGRSRALVHVPARAGCQRAQLRGAVEQRRLLGRRRRPRPRSRRRGGRRARHRRGPPAVEPGRDHAARLLDCAAFKLGEFESYIGLNEHDSHANVVAMFDHALDMARTNSTPDPEAS